MEGILGSVVTFCNIGALVLSSVFCYTCLFKKENKQKEDREKYKAYNISEFKHNIYKVTMVLKGGRDLELYIKSDRALKDKQLEVLMLKLEAEDKVKSGVYELDSKTYELNRVSSIEEAEVDILRLEKMYDVNNENAVSIKDTDIEVNERKGYSIHIK